MLSFFSNVFRKKSNYISRCALPNTKKKSIIQEIQFRDAFTPVFSAEDIDSLQAKDIKR